VSLHQLRAKVLQADRCRQRVPHAASREIVAFDKQEKTMRREKKKEKKIIFLLLLDLSIVPVQIGFKRQSLRKKERKKS
jgi:hypothetical protein